jgi:hypothetical protein
MERAQTTGLPVSRLGTVGGSRLVIEGLIDLPVAELNRIWRTSFAKMLESHG